MATFNMPNQPDRAINGFYFKPDGRGGVNYFQLVDTGKSTEIRPVAREAFEQGTGMTPGGIEQSVAQEYQSQSGLSAPLPGKVYGPGESRLQFRDSPPSEDYPTQPAGTGTTQGDQTDQQEQKPVPEPTPTPVLGSVSFYNPYTDTTTTYDLDDPTQAGAFYNDKLSALQSKRDEEVAKGKTSSDKQIADLNTQLNDTYQEAKGYVDTYLTNVNEFGDQYQMGNVKRQQFFAGLSPNAFQSSQGTSQAYAENKYIEGLGAYAKEANQNVGSAFLANAQQNPNSPDYSTLDANSALGRNVSGIKGAQQDVATAFNEFATQADQNVNQQAADTSTSLKAIDSYGKVVDPLAKATLNQVNNSAITPYTTFQQGGAQAPVQGTAPTTYGTTPIDTRAPLDQFLGTNKLSTNSKDYLSSWLKAHS